MNPISLVPFSPLVLCDQLLNLAREADRAGYRDAAGRLVALAHEACDPRKILGARNRDSSPGPARRRAPARAHGARAAKACAGEARTDGRAFASGA